MAYILIPFITTTVLVILDVILRGDLIKDNISHYSVIVILLFGFIYFSRIVCISIPNKVIRLSLGVLTAVLFSIIYWIQSAVYIVYYQFITAVDIGLIVGNLKYWQQGANKLLSIINLPWFAVYLIIFLLTFIYRSPRIPISISNIIRQQAMIFLIVAISSLSSLFYIKQKQLHYLTTPVMSLTHELRRFNLERPRFMKKVKPGAELDFYQRDVDQIPDFKRRGDFNILFVILESLRQDHMSLYGYERDTTPFQSQRFKHSFHFNHAISNTTSTDTSAELIFTGIDRTNLNIHSTSLLWSYLKQANLNLFYIGSHWLEWNGWFGRAFLSKDVDSIQAPLAVDASLIGYDMTTARKFKTTLAEFAKKDQPFFGVVHFAGTHYPYVSPPDYHKWVPADDRFEPRKVQELINKYNNAILYNDAAVEIIVNELEQQNLDDNTIIVVTADHAEAMYEHRQFFHGKVFWQEGIHVPLYIDIPPQLKHLFSTEQIENLSTNGDNFVSIVDLFPTILDLYNIPAAKKLDGFSLLRPYPESFIRVYMIPDEYAIIHSHSGEKFHVDNNRRIVRQTDLRRDPNEKNYTEHRTNRRIPIRELIDLVQQEKLAELTDSINNE